MNKQPVKCDVGNCPVSYGVQHHHTKQFGHAVTHRGYNQCDYCDLGLPVVVNYDPYQNMFANYYYAVLNGGTDNFYECNVCGALVKDRGKHVDWHATSHTWGEQV